MRKTFSFWQALIIVSKTISIYPRKSLFFSSILLFIFFSIFVTRGIILSQKGVAQEIPSTQTFFEIEIKSNGDITIRGKKYSRINFFPQYDEFRIILVDNPGQYLSNLKAVVKLPKSVLGKSIQPIIYATGGVGSWESKFVPPSTLYYSASGVGPGATISIVAKLPKGIITPSFFSWIVSKFINAKATVWILSGILLPIITFLLFLKMIRAYWLDRHLPCREKITHLPSDLPFPVVGILLNGVVGSKELSAIVVDLALKGVIYLIEKEGGSFVFGLRKEPTNLSAYERILLEKIFSVGAIKTSKEEIRYRLSHHIFSRKIARLYLELYNLTTKHGFFLENPARVHLRYKYLGVLLFFAGFAGFAISALFAPDPKFLLFFWIGEIIASLVIVRLAPILPLRTNLGRKVLIDWLCFRNFLTDPAPLGLSDASLFEKYLPYAIVLDCEKEWAGRFREIPFALPDWYQAQERVASLSDFIGHLFPLINNLGIALASSHEPTVE